MSQIDSMFEKLFEGGRRKRQEREEREEQERLKVARQAQKNREEIEQMIASIDRELLGILNDSNPNTLECVERVFQLGINSCHTIVDLFEYNDEVNGGGFNVILRKEQSRFTCGVIWNYKEHEMNVNHVVTRDFEKVKESLRLFDEPYKIIAKLASLAAEHLPS